MREGDGGPAGGMPPHWRTFAVAGLGALALAVRIATLLSTVDTPGDGPSRATLAYRWAHAPHLALNGTWPPGFMYLAGLFTFVLDDPAASRVLNVGLGALTVPVLFLLADRLFGPVVALVSAALLAGLPLHIGLSASSLTEPSFVLAMVAGHYLLFLGAAPAARRRAWLLGAALSCFVYAEMTRYEAWLLVVPVPAYLAWRTRDPRPTALAALALLAFPAAWTLGNAVYRGDPFVGFRAAMSNDPAAGPQTVGLAAALGVLGVAWVAHLGLLLPLCTAWGAGAEVVRGLRARLDAERALYLAIAALFWLVMLRFAMTRGASLFNRYLLLGFVLCLPLAVLPAAGRRAAPSLRRAGALLAIAVVSVLLARPVLRAYPERFFTPLWVTATRPVEIERFTAWLARSPYAGRALAATEMGWRSTYVPLYRPPLADRFMVVSDWLDDDMVRRFLRLHRPALLLTTEGDERHTRRIERVLGTTIDRRRVYSDGVVEAFELPDAAPELSGHDGPALDEAAAPNRRPAPPGRTCPRGRA